MYAGRVACCLLARLVEYAPRSLLKLEKDGTDRRTDGRSPNRYITLTARRGQRTNLNYRTDRNSTGANRPVWKQIAIKL